MLIERRENLQQLRRWRDRDLIKVITGVRRCGKSTLLDSFGRFLQDSGVGVDQIIRINLEDFTYAGLQTAADLHQYVTQRLRGQRHYYLLIDEVQNISAWQKAVNSLRLRDNLDIYLTGSNAFILSGELGTLLAGRYIEVKMLPFSLRELHQLHPQLDPARLYQLYVTRGGFPRVSDLRDEREVGEYLSSVCDSIILKDIVARYGVRDVTQLRRVISFLLDNIGNLCSTNRIMNTLRADDQTISAHALERYLQALEEAFIFYRARRYDIKGRQYLKTGDKYYVVDPGLRYFLQGKKGGDAGYILENVIYLELKRRGRDVYVGKTGSYEVDFAAIGPAGPHYYQVALSVRDPATLARELRALRSVSDDYPKTLLTLDPDPEVYHDGIRQINAWEWLLG